MKKVFTALLALLGFAMYTNAATVDEVKPLDQSYVCVLGDYTAEGAGAREAGALFGDGYFLDVTGGSLSTNKGTIDIADVSTYVAINGADVEALAAKYTTYGGHLNSLRLKNAKDVIAFKPITGSKVYVFGSGNNKSGASARIPKFANDAALTVGLNEAPGEDHPATANYVYEFVVPEGFDGTVPMYIGTYNGDAFFSYIVVEAPAPVVAGPQVAYLCGAETTTEDIYTALVEAGMSVTPLNYDDVTLDETSVSELAANYELVVLAGNTGSGTNLAKSYTQLLGKVPVLSTKSFWYAAPGDGGTKGTNPGTADAPSLNLTKTVAGHPIFAGIAGDEFAVFNDMAKSNGRYLQGNGAFGNGGTPAQTTLATNPADGSACIGEAWVDGMGWIIIPVDGGQPEGYLTADGKALFANVAKYLIAGKKYVAPKVAYLCGAETTTEAIYTAMVNAGMEVTPLNYDDVTLTEEIVSELAASYNLVVLAGNTGSGTNLAKSYTQLLGKVNVLSTKSFWYAAPGDGGTKGTNPGTAEAPSLNLTKAVADHPIFANIAGDEFAVFNDMAKSNGRYLQGNGAFGNGGTPAQTTLATNPADGSACIGEAWVDGKGYIIIPVDGAQPEGYLTADGEALFVNAANYLVAGEQFGAPAWDLTAYNEAVAKAEALKAQLDPSDWMQEELIVALDEAIAFAKEGIDTAASQEDVDISANMLAETVAAYEANVLMTKVEAARMAGEEVLAKYSFYTDDAGLVIALRNLPRFAMGMTPEDIQATIDAVYAAIPLFEAENAPLAAGTYYMKNVAAGKFLTGGNSWGTQASFGDNGLDVVVMAQENGKYVFDTNVPNGEKRYLGSNGFVDSDLAEWSLERVAKDTYTISLDGANYLGYDGTTVVNLAMTDAADASAHWQFVTKEELVAALAEATTANPVDATFFIVGQNFNRADNNRNAAWQGSPTLGGANENYCAEKWNANFDIYQDLAGLPNGYYKVSVQGYYRAGNGGATSMEQNAYLYAGEKSTPLVNINAEAGNAVFEGGNVSTVEGMGIVPNNMATASTAFTAGLYANNKLIVQVTDGTLRIGVKKETLIDADWTIFDNFQLTYYGTEEPPVIAPGTYYMKNVAAGKFLNGGNSWGTQASLVEHGFDVKLTFANGKYTIDTNVPNGAKQYLGSNGFVDSDLAEWTIVPAGENYAITLDGVNYIGSDGSSVVNLTLTDPTKAEAQWQFVTKEELVAALDGATIANPVDATFFIVGQNFNRADNNRNAAWQGSPTLGGANENFCAEKWNTNFDIYQDLAGLPNGYYKLSAQGYYRAGNGGATAMDQNAYLYAGEVSTPLMNINAHAGDPVISGNTSDVPGLGLVPNNMATASTAFSAGLYADNNLMVQVTDGTLRIGVKKETLIANDWTIFDNFELYYLGNIDPALLAAVDSLNALIAEAEAWKAELNAEDEMHAMVLGTLDMMIPAAQAVADAPTSVEQVNGMIFDVYSMLGTYKPMVEKYDAGMAATAAAEEAQALMDSFTNPSDDAGLAAAIANVQEGVALLNDWFEPITIEELNARVAAMRVAQKAFIYENPNKPVASYAAIQAENRVVALTHELEGLTIYYKTAEAADYMIYTAPFHISDNTSVWAYAEYVSPEGKAYASDVLVVEKEAGFEIQLKKVVVETVGDTEFTCTVTSDQSDIINNYGITPKETITYDFFPWIEAKGECAKVPSKSGVLTSGESVNGLGAGLLIVKVAAYGFESDETVEYLGAAENWAGGDAFVTGIDEVNAKEVKEVKYYTTSGAQIEEPVSGIYIQRVIFTDGTVKTTTVAGK